MSVLIPLTNTPGEYAVIDDDDAERVLRYNWRRVKPKPARSAYAYTTKSSGRRTETIPFHRFIMGLGRGDKRVVDHKNRSGLDCRKENLRITDSCCNSANVA